MAPVTAPIALGVVERFDVEVGVGVIVGDDGGRYFFHCAEIADGTRTITTGARARFRLLPGHLGRFEATSIAEVGSEGDQAAG